MLFLTWVLSTGLLAFLSVARVNRAVLVGLLPVALISGALVALNIMPGPKPYAWEWRTGDVEIVAARWIEDEGIWLWVVWPGEIEPKAYSLPWDQRTADAIETAARESGGDGEGGVMADFGAENDGEPQTLEGFYYEFSLEDRNPPMIYPAPQYAAPPKDAPERPPTLQFGEPR